MPPSVSRRILISPWLMGGFNGHFLPRLPWKYFRNPLKPSRLTQRRSQDHWLLWLSPKILIRLGRGVTLFQPLCIFFVLIWDAILLRNLSYLLTVPCGPALVVFRYEENGIQDKAVAWEVFCVLHLQEPDRDQVVHSKGPRHLLRKVLRGQVCNQMHQV